MTEIENLEVDESIKTPEGIRRVAELRMWNNTVVVSDSESGEKGGLLTIFDVSDIEKVE